jgi:hypothetical protein
VLIPSKAFIEEYQSKATTYRTLAWTFTGIAVAAAGSATGLFVWNDGRLSEYEQDREEFELDPTSHDSNELGERADSINLVDSVTIGIVAGALVSGGVSLYFWLAGEPPGRYEKIEDQPKSAFEISGSLGKDSIGATATFRF